jgi:hypothetical protein
MMITNFLHYYFDTVGVLSKKYCHLLSANDYKTMQRYSRSTIV